MKFVKKYYLVPENRYKVFIQNQSNAKSSPDVSLKSDKPIKIEEEKSQSAPEDNVQNLLQTSDTIPEKKEENPPLSEGPEGNRAPFRAFHSLQKGGKLTSPPPPGIPIKSKKKRQLPWISL
jgi:hypothetical protein